MGSLSRRGFLWTGVAAALGAATDRLHARTRRRRGAPAVRPARVQPAVAYSGNAFPRPLERAMELLEAGADSLDAAVAAANVVEDDPRDRSVGLGGFPNEDGIVELDASCMHGPTHEAGAVGGLRDVRNAASVARDVLWHTDHVMLVGEGARRFARMRGYPLEDLLTDETRQHWLRWKASHSTVDDWLEPGEKRPLPAPDDAGERETGTINVDVCNARGEVSGVTSTSGLAYKIPGRVGDSAQIGAGLYVHGEVGSAGSTGRGEAVIVAGGSRTVVDAMAAGAHPQDACLAAVRRVLDMNTARRLWRDDGKPAFRVCFYAVDVSGRIGGAASSPGRFGAADGRGTRRVDFAVP